MFVYIFKKFNLMLAPKIRLKMLLKHSMFIILTTVISTAYAQGRPVSQAGVNVGAGAGIMAKTNIRVNNNIESMLDFLEISKTENSIIMAIPVFSIRAYGFSLRGRELSYSLLRGPIGLDFKTSYQGHEYKTVNLSERKSSLFSGVSLRLFFFNLSVMTDVLKNRSYGTIYSASFGHMISISQKLKMRASIGIEHFNQNYVDYYFGVRENETSEGIVEYSGTSSLNKFISLIPMYSLIDKLNLSAMISYKVYGSGVNNSSTVRTNKELMSMISFVFSI